MMQQSSGLVYQFKITLMDSKPPIWRRILVPAEYRFWDLHVAIQDAMGWQDYHLHEFFILSPKTKAETNIGLPEEDECLRSTKEKIAKYFSLENHSAIYWYDFGDDWYHAIKLEKILPAVPGKEYPLCSAGKMACPPEDSGGIWGYYQKLEILGNPKDPDYHNILEWMGEGFDPQKFNPREVVFDDPKIREARAGII